MKRMLIALAKWSWFGLLMLLAFAYMASGLSEPIAELSSTSLEGDVSDQTRLVVAPSAETPSQSLEPTRSIEAIVAAMNGSRQADLAARGLQSAEPAEWLAVCRRMSLALVGSGLSLEEIRHLERLPESDRESAHLENLLADPRFHQYWSERWTRFLVGAEEGPFLVYRRRRFRHWLADQIAAERPYDEIVSDLITAEGLWTDQPEVNFLTVTFDSNDGSADPIRLAARTSRAFLGLRIDCLQCHSDFLGNVSLGDVDDPREGQQSDFHQLAAFYSSAKTNGLQGIRTEDPDYQYQYLDAEEEVPVEPVVPFSPELLPAKGDARARLAGWVTHSENRQFDRAAVARFWALMFGRSPTEAVDNLPLDEPFPKLLSPIVQDFSEHRDVRRVIRIIAGSDAFRVASRATFEITPEHEKRYAVFPLTRLRAEQVAGAIVQGSRIKSVDRDSSLLVQIMRFGSINDFLTRYGDQGENELTEDGITIPQRLLMLNGDMLRESGGTNPVLNATSHIGMFASDDDQLVETMFLSVLNRRPTDEEAVYFIERLSGADERGEAVEDLFWTLANTTEFTWNH